MTTLPVEGEVSVGVAIARGEVLDPVQTTRLILRETFRAIQKFNNNSDYRIEKVAAVSASLGINKLKAGEALVLLSESYLQQTTLLRSGLRGDPPLR